MQWLRAQRRELATDMLVACLFLLLVGLALQLPPPPPPGPPDTYSTLIKDVQAGQVIAVNLQGEDLYGLLRSTRGDPPGAEAAFAACFPGNFSACFTDDEQPLFPRLYFVK